MAGESSGRVVIISGPAGAGKSTIVRRLLDDSPVPLALSISATTRAPRPGEKDGVDYYFLSKDEFARRRELGEFLEWNEVFGRGDWYGTLESEVQKGFAVGRWAMLEIDVDGSANVLKSYPDAITIFLHSGSIEELERRLVSRGTETSAAIQRRLEVARHELAAMPRYTHIVINDSIDHAVASICEILTQYSHNEITTSR